MTYTELHKLAREMTPEVRDHTLAQLALDTRFAAVLAWLEANREDFIRGGSKQALADAPGKLAHGQGSVHAIHTLQDQLKQLLSPRPGARRAEPEGQTE